MSETDEPGGEHVALGADVWVARLEDEVRVARDMDIESHTTILDTEGSEHQVELGTGVDKVEQEGRHVKIWLAAGAGIITVTGGAVVAAIALIRHRRRQQ